MTFEEANEVLYRYHFGKKYTGDVIEALVSFKVKECSKLCDLCEHEEVCEFSKYPPVYECAHFKENK